MLVFTAVQCPRINACFESLPHSLFLTYRGENIFRCREVYGMHNDNNACDKEFKRKVFKALLLKVAALCKGCEPQPVLVLCSGSAAPCPAPNISFFPSIHM
jgi:hypothetical protein